MHKKYAKMYSNLVGTARENHTSGSLFFSCQYLSSLRSRVLPSATLRTVTSCIEAVYIKYYISLRKREIMPVLMMSVNMEPMMGTIRKGIGE